VGRRRQNDTGFTGANQRLNDKFGQGGLAGTAGPLMVTWCFFSLIAFITMLNAFF
jgi:hypothetical protein